MAKETTDVKRIHMLKSKVIDLGGSSSVHYEAGGLYLLPENEAKKWIKDGIAEREEEMGNG